MATIWNRIIRFWKGTNRSGMVRMTGSVLIGSSGAVTSYDLPGCTVTLLSNKTGRYRVQLIDVDGVTAASPTQPVNASAAAIAPWGIQAPTCTIASETADNALPTGEAVSCQLRNFTPLSGYFDIQCFKSVTSGADETHVDANPGNGAHLLIGFDVKLSSATP
jgi:hypothetical protein